MRSTFLVFACLFFFVSRAQQPALINGFAFERDQSVPVLENGTPLPMPWVGGLNYTSHANIDLDLDGTLDLIVFEKNGRRMLPFLAHQNGGASRFTYAPEYEEAFPSAENWIITADYNCDGKLDLFVGVHQFMKVYENTSTDKLSFQLAHNTSNLKTLYTGGLADLNTQSTDIPAIIDLDDDGDLDILTVYGSNGKINAHINQKSCGLDYVLQGSCWGLFTESGLANDVTLGTCVDGTAKTSATMHAGGSLLALDLNGDNLKDLLMSDVSFNDVVGLFNGGSLDSAVITSKILNYPTADPVDIYVYPAMHYADVTGDGVKDLIVTPNETSSNPVSNGVNSGPENVNNIYVYENNGTNGNPDFTLTQDDFLQEHMIDMGEGAVPRFVDLNGDSLQDLILANSGEFVSPAVYDTYFRYYENIGTKDSAAFSLVDGDFAQMSSYNIGQSIIPTFGDLDRDGDQDMIVGDQDGLLHYFINIGSASSPSYSLQTAGLGNIDVGNNAAPFLIDMDGDASLDLIVGNELGKIAFYTNASASNPNFTYVTDNLGGIRILSTLSGFGRSIPYAFTDSTGNINLMVGSSHEGIWQYDSIGSQVISTSSNTYTLGTGTTLTTNHKDSPFGIRKRSGRNQFLFTASELKAQGIGFGYIDAFYIYAEVPASLFPPFLMQRGFSVKMGLTNSSDLSAGFESTNMQVLLDQSRQNAIGDGWNRLPFPTPFLYDGSSNLVVEICFMANFVQNQNIQVHTSDAGFLAHAYGDADKNNFNTISSNGCAMPWEGSTNMRPNVRFEVSPAFANTDTLFNIGYSTAGAFADVNNDGYIDAVVGNVAGGVQFFYGKKFENDIGLKEPEAISTGDFSVYPNPGKGAFSIARSTGTPATLKVFSLNGAQVLSKTLNQPLESISLEHLPKGMYLFLLQEGDQVHSKKVIKN